MIGLVVVAVFSLDPLAKFLVERRIHAETGMETEIGKLTVRLSSSSLYIENFILKNPPEFGGGTFLEMPELYIAYDREALRSGKLHLKVVRIDIAKIHIVENKDGGKNIDELPVKILTAKPRGTATGKNQPAIVLDGIDRMEVSVRNVTFTNLRDPAQNMEQDLSIRNELFRNLKTDLDYQTAGALLTIKAGASFLFNGDFTNFGQLVKRKAKKEKRINPVSDELTNPVEKATETSAP